MVNKKGSTSIFLILVLGGMITLVVAYIAAAEKTVAKGVNDGLFRLAGRSVLTEYNKGLKGEYGLFGYSLEETQVEEKLRFYLEGCEGDSPRDVGGIRASLGEYSFCNCQIFKEEVLEYANFAIGKNLLEDLTTTEGGEGNVLKDDSTRSLNNEVVIQSLPSQVFDGDTTFLDYLTNSGEGWENAFKEGSDNNRLNQYIMTFFSNRQEKKEGEHFFDYEVEYLLEGKMTDQKNKNKLRNHIVLFRNGVNLIFLLTDPVKRSEIITAASVLTPGPEAIITQVIIAEAWALAESENDMLLLEHGKKVPMVKTGDMWAVDLQSVLEDTSEGYIDIDCEIGVTYEGYLQFFLFIMDENTKLLRLMDLIQINMQLKESKYFLLRNHYVGFYVEGKIEGREYRYEQTY